MGLVTISPMERELSVHLFHRLCWVSLQKTDTVLGTKDPAVDAAHVLSLSRVADNRQVHRHQTSVTKVPKDV